MIVDTGVGIRAHLSRHAQYRGLTNDLEALRIALTLNVTGTHIANREEGRLEFEREN